MDALMRMVRHPLRAVLLLLLVLSGGALAYRGLSIDVFPDPSPVQVQVLTEAEGMAPEEVENRVTAPVERALQGLPQVSRLTSLSAFGLSTVSVTFADGVDLYWARQWVSQQLAALADRLPEGVEAPGLGPVSTGLGMVYIYALEGPGGAMALRTLQDWVVKYQLQVVPGVAGVLSHGGEIRQYQVRVDSRALQRLGLGLTDLVAGLRAQSRNVAAGYLIRNGEESLVRGLGLVRDLEDLRRMPLKTAGGSFVPLEQVARVEIGPALRRGAALLDDQGETVAGLVMKLVDVNTARLIEDLDRQMSSLAAGLPAGVRLVPVYNQSRIIKAAFATVSEALWVGVFLVVLVLLLFISDLGAALVSALSIPFSVGVAFLVLRLAGMSADLMSFGGLAIGIGLLVDAAVVVVENIIRFREMGQDTLEGVRAALAEVLHPLAFALGLMALSFLPILTLEGMEGVLFAPFAWSLLAAIGGAGVYALAVAPALAHRVRLGHLPGGDRVFGVFQRVYMALYDALWPRPRLTLALFTGFLLLCGGGFLHLGSEFIPRINEQTLQVQVVLPTNTDVDSAVAAAGEVHRILGDLPEIEHRFTRLGRGDGGTHAHPVNMLNTILTLKPGSLRGRGRQEALEEEIRHRLAHRFPGAPINLTQPIRHNLDHMITGVQADVALKIYGRDFGELQALGRQAASLLEKIPGARDVQAHRISGASEVQLRVRRDQAARYGLTVQELLETVEAAVGGRTVSRVYEDDRWTDVFLRLEESERQTMTDLGALLIPVPGGERVPLNLLADLELGEGLAEIGRENGQRFQTVQTNVGGRDVGGFVREARALLEQKLHLPVGYRLDWGGQYTLKNRAERRLWLVVLGTLLLLGGMLKSAVGSWGEVWVVLLSLPFALSGGVLALALGGGRLSVPASIGFIALLGIALENNLLLSAFARDRIREGMGRDQAWREAVRLRLRPVLMTKFTTIIGLLPLVFA